MPKPLTQAQKGYTLFELTLVALIVSIVLIGVIGLMNAFGKGQKHQTEKTELAVIKSAIIQFAIQNGRLPCPDIDGNGNMGAGQNAPLATSCDVPPLGSDASADTTAQRRVVAGYLPYKDLGVTGQNQYGHPFQYVVTLHYADIDSNTTTTGRFKDPTPFPSTQVSAVHNPQSRCSNAPARSGQLRPSFSACSKGGVDIQVKTAQGNVQTLYSDMPFVVISLGQNGKNSSTTSEQINIKDSSGSFINTNTQNAQNRVVILKDASNLAFDDALTWETSGILALHLLEAGMLP